MKKNKLFIIIAIALCAVGIAATLAIKFLQPGHKHNLAEARIYHVSQNQIYYTRCCDDGYVKEFSTEASLIEVMKTVTKHDKIVLDEDIVLTEDLKVWSFVPNSQTNLNLNINLDLNNHQISTDIDNDVNGAMFNFNANIGSIRFNIKNGKLYSEDFEYLFQFQNSSNIQSFVKSIIVNIDNVECVVKGNNVAPMFVDNTSKNIEINATGSKFIAQQENSTTDLNLVGAFINSQNSNFNFINCDFSGADALYIKQGNVNLNGCKFNSILDVQRVWQPNDTPFYTKGAAILAESYNSSVGCTQFNITISNCELTSASVIGGGIYLIQNSQTGYEDKVNDNSSITVNSGKFTAQPTNYINSLGHNVITYSSEPVPQLIDGKPMFVVE